MPARAVVSLILIVILAGGMTILLADRIGLPFAALGLVAVAAALVLRLWMGRR